MEITMWALVAMLLTGQGAQTQLASDMWKNRATCEQAKQNLIEGKAVSHISKCVKVIIDLKEVNHP